MTPKAALPLGYVRPIPLGSSAGGRITHAGPMVSGAIPISAGPRAAAARHGARGLWSQIDVVNKAPQRTLAPTTSRRNKMAIGGNAFGR